MTMNYDTTTIIPAEPGWRVCDPIGDDSYEVADLDELEVIAWAVTYTAGGGVPDGYALPLTADTGVERNTMILRSPTGRYFRPEERDFGTDKQAAIEDERARNQYKHWLEVGAAT